MHRGGFLIDTSNDDDTAGRGRGRFPATSQAFQAGTRWPSPLKRGGEDGMSDRYRRRRSASLGRERESSPRRGRRRAGAEMSRGSTARSGRGYSWSPPRTRTGTASVGGFPEASTAGSNMSFSSSNGNPFDPESGQGGQVTRSYSSSLEDEEQEFHREWRASSRLSDGNAGGGADHSHWPTSPLMLPLDPYRSSRTVVRAGTAVSLSDAAAAEHSSRRAALYIRRAAEARAGMARRAAGETAPMFSSPGRGRRWGKQQQDRQRHSRNDFRTTSGTALDVHEEEERWGDKIRRFLPSVESIEWELRAIKRADAAMREEQLAQVYESVAIKKLCQCIFAWFKTAQGPSLAGTQPLNSRCHPQQNVYLSPPIRCN